MIRKLLVLTAAAAAVAVGVGVNHAAATDIAPPPISVPDSRPDIVVTNPYPAYPYVHEVSNVGAWATPTGYFRVIVHSWRTAYPAYDAWWYAYTVPSYSFWFSLGAGASQTFSVSNQYVGLPPCGWLITADPANDVGERNETNNTYYHDAC